MYPNMAKTAKEEGFDRIAKLFEAVGRIEKQHQQRYSEYAGMLEKGEYYQRTVKTLWICTSCGHLYEGEKPLQSVLSAVTIKGITGLIQNK